MLIDINHIEHFYIICRPTDFRKGIEGCVQIASQINGLDPFSESIFLFCNRSKDALKVLHFDLNGFEILMKELLESKYQWPKSNEEAGNGGVCMLDYDKLTIEEMVKLCQTLWLKNADLERNIEFYREQLKKNHQKMYRKSSEKRMRYIFLMKQMP